MSTAPRQPVGLKPIGEKLVEAGLLSHAQLDLALNLQKQDGRRLGELLRSLGFLDEAPITRILAQEIGVDFVELKNYTIDREVVGLIPERIARECKAIALEMDHGQLVVALEDPLDIPTVDRLRRVANSPIKVVAATSTDIRQHHNKFYTAEHSANWDARDSDTNKLIHFEVDTSTGSQGISAPIVKLINSTIQEALLQGATDIHFEPEENAIRVRYRIDGILHNRHSVDRKLMSPLATRLKIMARLNITESRVPQSGGAKFTLGKKNIDMRISTFPSIHGENIVLRLLDKDRLLQGLESLGYTEKNLEILTRAINMPNGILLVTGPTGSGKTTTLYCALMHLSGSDKKIITLEDPVEYELSMIRQSQINIKAGLTFAEGLRTVLRQDPDIILVGEMRDSETIETAIRAALTGHLVLSTLHTNDAVGAITRLEDMGVEPYLISSSIILLIAQRLVRLICNNCKRPVKPDPKLLERVDFEFKNAQFFEGEGCQTCNYTGFRGRTAISELLTMNDKIRNLIMQKADASVLERAACETGMETMLMDGIYKVLQGKTTLQEVFRVTSD